MAPIGHLQKGGFLKTLRKVTLEIPEELLQLALDTTGLSVASTLRVALALAATHPALRNSPSQNVEKNLKPR